MKRVAGAERSRDGKRSKVFGVSLFEFPVIPIQACSGIDGFERLNVIEEGSYGVVSRAREKATGQLVALKRLKRDRSTASEGFPITSVREIKALKKLQSSPNVVQLQQVVVGSRPSDVYLVMEYVEHDLYTLMSYVDQFLMSEIKTLLLQLLSAVESMHRSWIFHRDLKTANLLITNRGMLKVADFGLAAEFGTGYRSRFTPTVVTVRYRAPEVFVSRGNYSHEIDMWSVGCIFAELLNHKVFFQGTRDLEVLGEIFRKVDVPNENSWPGFRRLPDSRVIRPPEKPPIPLSKSVPRANESALDLLSRMLTINPAKRISAQKAFNHPFFSEDPLPKDPSLFPSFPSKGSKEI
ncbi:hypothetical protein TRICI_005226 [Trichomonascus ciferrii]|uniref:Protein kinase domain-containing protein n=1 Tax=Trichomonascus ciferrii TaxID=44093 RepID=A0A642UUT1_9ASCO|nr:hypothetical protein TRICI_005226 [Trichomonascus ciferrii]